MHNTQVGKGWEETELLEKTNGTLVEGLLYEGALAFTFIMRLVSFLNSKSDDICNRLC